ncbi:MAG: hypothetical protein M1352_03270 [Patescibacteria group bacterium]|nr:hypothetical protein [Patescibacteria group bacterium]
MVKISREIKIEELEKELAALKDRLSKTLRKSNDIFYLGGDGWHDNPAYDLMNADVDKISLMIEQIREEIADLRKSSPGAKARRVVRRKRQ